VRGCLGFLVFAITAVAVLAFVVVQFALPAVVTSAVRSSPLVRGQNVAVQVDTSLTGLFLHGRIDRIVITGRDLSEPSATIADVSVTLSEVSILDRTFATAAGTLSGVDVEVGSSAPILHIEMVNLSGSASTLTAEVQVSRAAAEAGLLAPLRAAGVPVDAVSLARGRIDLTIAGLLVETQTVLTESGLSLQAGPLSPSVPILSGPAGGAWRIDEVDVTTSGLRIVLSIALR
jgi:hypothetical protein